MHSVLRMEKPSRSKVGGILFAFDRTYAERSPMGVLHFATRPRGYTFVLLRQHRTIWQEHSAKDFASYESYKRAGISVSKKSFRHAVRIFKLSKKFKNTCRLNVKGAFCPLHTSPAALSQTFSARFFDSLNTVVFPPFITARMGQKIGRRPQTQLCGDALENSKHSRCPYTAANCVLRPVGRFAHLFLLGVPKPQLFHSKS